ncbi:D-gamma-glutamyl-meso-diaminopimelic acid endopeptidase CwlS precursor [Oxobacter pfennigii]|uniref:D-gamma-glutamyl-meso-diaminopimelic acid endopeptidase CwlS n=1 Tax=Oxobacter pfennigii TaxID=36849 RepID=A0A0P9AH63_9CLOT|nr:LysM peptidoglycan-binding domain-containing protein [Oxobacter pfennigii]KPU44796.1 D-gamma-glutamyl-meso-diaminopimelic acid endopeptidase CwlS precursor [Oxobacter pfennigii]
MNFRKLLVSGILSTAVFAGSITGVFAQNPTYTVQKGDTYWLISQKLGISIQSLMAANNADQNTVLYIGQNIKVPQNTVHTVKSGETYWTISKAYSVDFNELLRANNATDKSWLNVGDKVVIPYKTSASQTKVYTVQKGDTYWNVSQKFGVNIAELLKLNGADEKSYLYIGQQIKIPAASSDTGTAPQPETGSKPYITYTNYTVQKGDILWNIADKFGIPLTELLQANNLSQSSMLNINDVLKIPVHHIPVKSTPGPKYGEALDWWTEAQYVIPVGADFEVVDFYTGKSFYARRTTGANHADCETLTLEDTKKMKEIWGGSFSWTRRPVLIKYNGRQIAASVSSMPHAGNDAAAAGVWTSWRSDNYGAGTNFDWIKNNGIDGHFDIHFLNSTRHNDGSVDAKHQANIKIAAGLN